MTQRPQDARGRVVWKDNLAMICAVLVALFIGYAWGRPTVQMGGGETVQPTIQQVALTPTQQAQLDRLAVAIARMDDAEPTSLSPSERDAIREAEEFLDSVTTTEVIPPAPAPAPTTTQTLQPLPTTDPPSGRNVHDLVVPQSTTSTTTSSTVP